MTLSDSEWDELVGRLRGLVVSLSTTFTPDECREVEHFIDHDEFGEALHALASIIIDGDKEVPAEIDREVTHLAQRMGIESDVPARFASNDAQ